MPPPTLEERSTVPTYTLSEADLAPSDDERVIVPLIKQEELLEERPLFMGKSSSISLITDMIDFKFGAQGWDTLTNCKTWQRKFFWKRPVVSTSARALERDSETGIEPENSMKYANDPNSFQYQTSLIYHPPTF